VKSREGNHVAHNDKDEEGMDSWGREERGGIGIGAVTRGFIIDNIL